MLWIAKRVEKNDGYSPYPLTTDFRSLQSESCMVQWDQYLAVFVHALTDLVAVLAWYQRLWALQKKIINIVANLGSHLEHIPEAFCGNKCGLCSLALDQGIGDQCCRVDSETDLTTADICFIQ